MLITYLTSFARNAEEYNLQQFPAAAVKTQYIIDVLKANGHSINVVSSAGTKNRFSCLYKREILRYDNKETDVRFATIGSKFKLIRSINFLLLDFSLLKYLICTANKDDKIVVYHSLRYITPVTIAKKIKHFNLVLELEEIYGDVIGSPKIKKRELKYCKLANSFIFPTELLNCKINISNKPYTIIHGTYRVEPNRKCAFNDEKIHVVYAGTFDPRKGGAAAAAAAAEFLDDHYHVHIIGFGAEDDKQLLLNTIDCVSKKSKCIVSYDGLKSGEEYIQFLQSCDIGLSTQNPEASFNATSFPSKILSYMANGLRVVSIRIPAIESSAVGPYMYYYDTQTPKEIAKAIMSVNMSDSYDSRAIIKKLNDRFVEDIDRMISI